MNDLAVAIARRVFKEALDALLARVLAEVMDRFEFEQFFQPFGDAP